MASDHNVSWSIGDEVTVKLSTSEPGRPRNFTVTAGDRSATLNWAPPTRMGGSSIYTYEYRYKTDGEYGDWIDTGTAGTSHVVRRLKPVTEHTFELRAVNDTGGGPPSEEFTVTLPAGVPGAPDRAYVVVDWKPHGCQEQVSG